MWVELIWLLLVCVISSFMSLLICSRLLVLWLSVPGSNIIGYVVYVALVWILNFPFGFLPASSGHFVVPYFFQLFSLHGFCLSVFPSRYVPKYFATCVYQMVCYWFDCGLVISQCEDLVESFPCIFCHGIVFIPVTKSGKCFIPYLWELVFFTFR